MSKPSFVYVSYIRATPEKVFDAITDRELTALYWGHRNASDWKVGSTWEHQRIDGSDAVDIVGTVIENDRPRRLVITWASPATAADPEKVSRVVFDIEPYKAGAVKLTVTHSELEPNSGMLRGISAGWPLVLSALKSFLETGTSTLIGATQREP
jgi:uncharacterized protein YndB with AHSA1/START domain